MNDLTQRIEKLEKLLAEHQHLGVDGSKEFDGKSKIDCKEITITGSGKTESLFDVPNFRMYDDGDISEERRKLTIGIGVSNKGEENERDNLILQVGKGEINKASNIEDWTKKNFAQTILSHDPQGYPWFFFSKNTPPTSSFLITKRTPIIFGQGTISGDTLTDTTAIFPEGQTPTSLAMAKELTNGVIHSICLIKDQDFNTIEAVKILEATKTTLKFENEPTSQGAYRYEILTPGILGASSAPYSIGYFGDGLILGYGERTTANKVSSITWGKGSPEGQVFAAPGSLYLNQDGGAGTTLYIKETGVSSSGWVAK